MTKKKGMIKLCSCSFPEVDKCVKKESTSLHSLFLSWAISYWIDNCLLYCNTLNNIHKCLNPTVVLSMNNNRFFFFFCTRFFSWIYLWASLSVAETPSNVSGVTLHSWTVPVKSSSSWRANRKITTHSEEPSSMTTLLLLYPLSITTSYPSSIISPLFSCGNVNRLWWSIPAH